MRILLASSSSGSRGGGEIFLRYLVDALHTKGHEVGLWMADHHRMDELAAQCAGSAEILRGRYDNTYDLRGRSLHAFLHRSNRRSARENWQSWKPDLIQINKQNLEDGLDLMKAAEGLPIPSICTIHITQTANFLKASNARIRDLLSRLVLKRHQGIFTTVAESRKTELGQFLGPASSSRVRRVYNGTPDPDQTRVGSWRKEKRESLGLTPEQVLITMVGRMTAQKSPEVFLDKARQILRIHPNHRFLWVGDGDYETEWDRQCAKGSLLEGKVFRLPWEKEVLP
ncbi:MAG: glycosyltransferase, partial [Verrucomicrobiota bacterium]